MHLSGNPPAVYTVPRCTTCPSAHQTLNNKHLEARPAQASWPDRRPVVGQNGQAISQPACDETHMVVRSLKIRSSHGSGPDSLRRVRRDEARRRVAALAGGRDRWLIQTVSAVQAHGVWLVGSLGSGTGDEWSDLDIIVVGGEFLLDEALLTLEMPGNGPLGGAYTGAMYDIDGLPLWVDWYRWPSGTPIPREARLLAGTGPVGNLDLSATLELVGREPPGPAPDPEVFALAMLPLAAKQLARGDLEKATAMAAMVDAPSDMPVGAALSAVLDRIGGHETATATVRRYLEIVRVLVS